MAGYTSTSRHESKTIPGVVFILKKLTEGRRIELRRQLAKPQAKMGALLSEMTRMNNLPPEEQNSSEVARIAMEFDDVTFEEINPTWVKWGLKSVEGLVVDDRTLTAEDALDFPSELFQEILDTIMGNAELREEDSKNSESPSTSGSPEAGKTKSTTAEVVEITATSETGTVGSTSQDA